MLNRRHLLQSGAAFSAASLARAVGPFPPFTGSESSFTDEKTLVCLFFAGGLDSYNLLVPTGTEYGTYATSRSDLALAQNSLLPLTGIDFGLHENCPEMQAMFNAGKLSFLSNVGTLASVTTAADVIAGTSSSLPFALASHFDQARQWETSLPRGSTSAGAVKGWAGRLSDVINSQNNPFGNNASASMNISLAGNNLFQVGDDTSPLVHQPGGTLGLFTDNRTPQNVKNDLHEAIMGQTYRHAVQENFARISERSIAQQAAVKSALDSFDESQFNGQGNFAGSIGAQLKDAVKLIAARRSLGLNRQTIFIRSGGWDMHGGLLEPFAGKIRQVSQAIAAFQNTLDSLGLANSVVSFSASDFARTLRSNGRGSDHAWGGPQFVFGGPVDGGKLFGDFPDLTLGSSDDIGRGGRIVPTIATDEYFRPLIEWFGVSNQARIDAVLPNLSNFNGRAVPQFIA